MTPREQEVLYPRRSRRYCIPAGAGVMTHRGSRSNDTPREQEEYPGRCREEYPGRCREEYPGGIPLVHLGVPHSGISRLPTHPGYTVVPHLSHDCTGVRCVQWRAVTCGGALGSSPPTRPG